MLEKNGAFKLPVLTSGEFIYNKDEESDWCCGSFDTREQAKYAALAINHIDSLLDMLLESLIQLEYMHEKFQETGSGNSVLTRGYALLDKIKEAK